MLEAHSTAQDLKEARIQCQGMTGESPNQASEPKAEPQPGSETPQAIVPVKPPPAVQASVVIESTPSGADIEIDGAFVGNTPSTVSVAPGSHQVAVKKKGYTDWTKTLNVTGGTIHLNAELEQAPAK
jgi:hypothetical protein